MAWPADATKTHLDAGTDDPSLARAELADLVDKFNDLKGELVQALVTLGIGDGLESDGGTPAKLRAKLPTNSGLGRDGTGLYFKPSDLLTVNDPQSGSDKAVIYDASNSGPRLVLLSDILALTAGVPAGVVAFTAAGAAPTGWLLANGAAVDRTTYADLFAAISTAFGVGDGSTTFNLPDLRQRVPLGVGTGYALAATGGSVSSNISVPLKNHTHMSMVQGSLSVPSTNTTQASTTNKFVYHSGNVGSRDNEETRMAGTSSATPNMGQTDEVGDGAAPTISVNRLQPYLALNGIIKT